jgi:hypothetical protein
LWVVIYYPQSTCGELFLIERRLYSKNHIDFLLKGKY